MKIRFTLYAFILIHSKAFAEDETTDTTRVFAILNTLLKRSAQIENIQLDMIINERIDGKLQISKSLFKRKSFKNLPAGSEITVLNDYAKKYSYVSKR